MPSAYIPVRVALITCWKNAFVASSEASGLKPGAKGGSGSITCWKNAFVASSEASGLKPGAKGGSGSFRTCTGSL